MKRKPAYQPKPDYGSLPWRQTSGDVEQDARYVCTLSTRDRRQRELLRLQHFHGYRHRDLVEQSILAMWGDREQIKQEMNVCTTWDQVEQFLTNGELQS